MKKWVFPLLLWLLLAVVIHLVVVWAYPYAIMALVDRKIKHATGIGSNQVYFPTLASPDRRTVVMPSPDLLISMIFYDVRRAPLRINAVIPADNYWSLAFYGSNTDNFFTINDRQVRARTIDMMLIGPEASAPAADDIRVVRAPSPTGVILGRILIDDKKNLDKLDKIRKQLSVKLEKQGG